MHSSVRPTGDLLLPAGTVVDGAYRVVRALAEGGMGTVYEAEQLTTGARRALKVMHGHFAHDDALRERFVREARLAASIPSDHVAQIIDAGHDEDTHTLYIVMELLEGTTLARELRRRGAFAWTDALEVLRQVAHGLGAAHELAIVHRDLKPANVFLSPSRNASGDVMVKVLDFGIAKAVAGVSESTGALLGTPSWMAPEQTTTDAPIGPETDVWPYGLLTYMMLTGLHFFPAANLAHVTPAVLLREVVMERIPPASERAAGVERGDRLPPGFDDWFDRCVNRDSSARFHGARAAYEALAALHPPSPREMPRTFAEDPPTTSLPSLPRSERIPSARVPNLASFAGEARSLAAPTLLETRAAKATPSGRRATVIVAVVGAIGVALAMVAAATLGRTPAVPPVAVAEGDAVVGDGGAPAAVSKALVRLHGSNTIGSELAPALAEAFLKQRTGATIVRRTVATDTVVVEARQGDKTLESIEIEGRGTATAFEDLDGARCDVGMASRRVHEDEARRVPALGNLASAANENVIGLDGIAVIVNPTRGVTALGHEQLAAIFSGSIASWSDVHDAGGADLGPGGNAGTGPVVVYALDGRSGTVDTFQAAVLGDRRISAGAKRFQSSVELSDAVAADADGIGFIGLPYVRSAKAVMVREATATPVLPSTLAVSTEDYPLARRLYLYLPVGAPPAARALVDFALSDAGQAVVQTAGFVDLRPVCDPNPPRCTTCSTDYREATRGACRLSVDFRFDHDELDTRALRDLQRVTTLMHRPENTARALVLLGFSGGGGDKATETAASARSVSAVATQLRARGLRVDVARGLGSEVTIADPSEAAGRERNRRVEVWLR